MRLGGRLAAAIEVLDDIARRHRPVADALKDWGLSHRFAGARRPRRDRQHRLRRAAPEALGRLAARRRHAARAGLRRAAARMGPDARGAERGARRRQVRAAAADAKTSCALARRAGSPMRRPTVRADCPGLVRAAAGRSLRRRLGRGRRGARRAARRSTCASTR